ncbi:YkvA family protein [Atopococcus tabaci]|uniref:YkvA family protein n=1 Tax=Atopococcus tabaci TaxID=269774 RepID=UPI00240A4089|nr:DUF1232 domain-containing protein [Atopococcus tabaci]
MKTRKKTIKTPTSKIKHLVLSLFNGKMDNKKKLAVLGIILYIVSPIDIVPDFLPVAGYADDILLPILLIVADKLIQDNPEDPEISEPHSNRRQVN